MITGRDPESHEIPGVKRYCIEPYEGLLKAAFDAKNALKNLMKGKGQRPAETGKGINTNSPLGIRFLWSKILRSIRREKPDAVHIQWLWDYYPEQVSYIAKLAAGGVRFFYTFHNSKPHEGFAQGIKDFFKALHPHLTLCFTHSEFDKKEVTRLYGIPGDKVRVLKMFNPLAVFPKEKKLDPRMVVLLFFGYIRQYKGLDRLIGLLGSDDPVYDNVKLHILGSVSDKDRGVYEELIGKNGRKQNIEWDIGYAGPEKVSEAFAHADVLVLPYRDATQSAVIPLAYYTRTPVIVNDVGGLSENVSDGRTGFVLKEPFEERFTALLKRENIKELLGEMSGNALSYYNDNLETEKVIDSYIKMISSFIR